jgi:hypothetical protein
MVVIRSYTRFAAILQSLGGSEQWAAEQEELRRGAIAITEAVLFVKQHSVNCISAAMYAMTCFDPAGFPPEEAGRFAEALFSGQGLPPAPSTPDAAAAALLRDYIYSLYTRFLSEGNASTGWTTPLRTFLAGPA